MPGQHVSIALDEPIELINITPINPLISKCQIKVCYVGEKPNRNGSIITKAVARELANSLPGSPIVGYYDEGKGDFDGHNRIIDISHGQIAVKETTRPYGFVSMDAKVWFQKFSDDGVEHEYLVTEGYLWTGQYPECKRVITEGNNQSMELDDNLIDARWTKDSNGNPEFFIINEAVMSKLCILGDDVEPCFEGASITKVQFSFDDSFKQELFSMMEQMKEILNKGGTSVFKQYAVAVGDNLWTALYNHLVSIGNKDRIDGIYEDDAQKFAVLQNQSDNKYYRLDFSFDGEKFEAQGTLTDITDSYTPAEEPQFALADVESFESEFAKKKDEDEEDKEKEDEEKEGDEPEEEGSKPEEDKKEEDDEKKKKKFNLEEEEEYISLKNSFEDLQSRYSALESEISQLREFKNSIDREKKQDMIKQFYMLSDDDKKDVVENIDKYSLDEIEAKLSVICVRNKVSFEQSEEKPGPTTFHFEEVDNDPAVPAWVRAAQETAKTMQI